MAFDPNQFSIEVVHYKEHDDATYIGRGSPLGNPFPMYDESERESVCDQYEKYLAERLKNKDPEIMDELYDLMETTIYQGYIKLGCFCRSFRFPNRRCHGDTVKTLLEKYLKE